eukprot:2269256-Rhodomonas_salina.1
MGRLPKDFLESTQVRALLRATCKLCRHARESKAHLGAHAIADTRILRAMRALTFGCVVCAALSVRGLEHPGAVLPDAALHHRHPHGRLPEAAQVHRREPGPTLVCPRACCAVHATDAADGGGRW